MSASEFVFDYFRTAAATGRMGHAYLLSGVTGDAAVAVGQRIACIVLCAQGGCTRCSTCRNILAGVCPDLHVLRAPPERRVIQVEDIRRTVIREAALKSYGRQRKVFLIIDADTLTDSAANGFLKTLEEPPGDSVMLLFSDRPETMPPTVASRCFRLRLEPETVAPSEGLAPQIQSEIIGRLGTEPFEANLEIADAISRLCRGDNLEQRRRLALELLDTVMVECRNGLLGRGGLARLEPASLLEGVDWAAEARKWIHANVNLDLVIDNFVTKFMKTCSVAGDKLCQS